MDNNHGPRRSDHSNKGVPLERMEFENYGLSRYAPMQVPSNNGAYSGDNTLVREEKLETEQPKHVKSTRANTKISKQRSIREVAYLTSALEKEKEIHEIEMMQLAKKKEFLMKSLSLEKDLKEKEDALSNDSNEELESEINDEQHRKDVHEWINKIPPVQPLERSERTLFNPGHRQREEAFESTRLHPGAEINSQFQNDVLIAALKALQASEAKDLPTFNGENVLEWPNFISEFRRSTEEYDIKPNKNLRRLNKALEGDARASVQTLLTSPDNIDEIISHLEMSFGRKEWILEHLVVELRSLPIMDEEENIHQFKLFYSKLFGAITTIRNMKAENYIDGPELLSSLEEKLPPTTKSYWIHYKANLYRNNTKVNIVELGEWFKNELDAQYAGLSAKDVIKKPMSNNVDNHSSIKSLCTNHKLSVQIKLT